MRMTAGKVLLAACAWCACARCAPAETAPVRGAYPLLVTPWTETAELDVDVLVKEAEFVDRCGANGVIWPSAGEALGNLSDAEYRAGLEALAARAAKGNFRARVTAVCPGLTEADALARVRFVNELRKKHGIETAILMRPPNNATNETRMAAFFRAAGKTAQCPVIIQTFNEKFKAQPSVKLLVELAKEFPDVYGYIKEESPGMTVNERMAQLVAAKPAVKTVFSGWGAKGFLYQGTKLGARGIVTQRAGYADLLAYLFKRVDEGDDGTLIDAYSKLLLMYNLGDVFDTTDDQMRGPHLYVLQKRGVFRNRLTRAKDAKGPIFLNDTHYTLKDFALSPLVQAEIDSRLEALKPYLAVPVP